MAGPPLILIHNSGLLICFFNCFSDFAVGLEAIRQVWRWCCWEFGEKMANDELQENLLKKPYYENCPGCMVDEMKERQRGLPITKLLAIWTVVLSAGN